MCAANLKNRPVIIQEKIEDLLNHIAATGETSDKIKLGRVVLLKKPKREFVSR